jgi:hypothetical protein
MEDRSINAKARESGILVELERHAKREQVVCDSRED